MSSKKMRDILQLTEGEYIPFTDHSLKTPKFPYEMYRALLHITNPASYTINNKIGNQGIIMFYSKQEYEYFISKMKELGLDTSEITYQESTFEDEQNTTSPVPGESFRAMKS